jgi:hypothetical protein
MADRESLENLIEGLAGAVVEAQRRIEQHQIDNLRLFFDDDDRPTTINILVPSLHPHAKSDEDVVYRVPLLPIVASSLLRIKDVEITFDADLVGLTGEEGEEKGGEKKKSVRVDIGGGRKTGKVHIVMKVEGREPSEGTARLVDRLLQLQGEVIT